MTGDNLGVKILINSAIYLICHKIHVTIVFIIMKVIFCSIFSLLFILNAQCGALSLSEYIALFKNNSLDIKMSESQRTQSKAQSNIIGLEPPEIAILSNKDSTGNKASGWELGQKLLFPTKIIQQRNIADKTSQFADAEFELTKSSLFAEAKLKFVETWLSQEKIKVLEERASAIKEHLKIARSTARSDSFANIHVLKTETDLELLNNNIIATKQELKNLKISLFNLAQTDYPEETLFAEPPLSTIPKEGSAIVTKYQFQAQLADSLVSRAKSNWLPDINFKYKKMGSSPTAMAFTETSIGISLPFVFFWDPRNEVATSIAKREESDLELIKAKSKLDADKSKLTSELDSLKTQIKNYEEKIIPAAEKRMRLVHNIAPRDLETLQDHREASEAFPEYKLQVLDLRREYERKISELESIVGLSI